MVAHPEDEHQPTNGTTPTAPYTEADLDRLTQRGVRPTWEEMDAEDRLACYLANPHVDQWLDDDALATFADFRPLPTQWARIKAGYRYRGGDSRLLTEAVQAVLDLRRTAARPHAIRISARALKAEVLPPLNFVIAEILPAGCTLLTGKSKEGKSMLAYNLAVAVASGEKALGTYPTMAGSVWYLALEDGKRRAQTRLDLQEAQMGPLSEAAQDRLAFTVKEAPRLGEGLEEDIRAWIATTPDARLLIIDILELVRPLRTVGGNWYTEDYLATRSLTQLAEDHNLSILVLHHSNKSNPADFRDSASGAMSLLGGADNFWSLSRQPLSEDGTLKITGRDLPHEYDLAMQFKDGYWTALGESRYVTMSKERQAIVDVLQESKRPLTPTQIATALGKHSTTTKMLLAKMLTATVVFQPTAGHYALSPSYLSSQQAEREGKEEERTVDPVDSVDPVDPVDSVDSPIEPIEKQGVDDNIGVEDSGGQSRDSSGPVYGESTPVYGESTAEDFTQPLEKTRLSGDTVYGSTESMGFMPVTDCLPPTDGAPPADIPAPCFHCRGTIFWRNASGQPLCCRCHPQPRERS
jgi:hypothetical protein